jgi:pimeloyl-ACP methyl ester carboxylesterase
MAPANSSMQASRLSSIGLKAGLQNLAILMALVLAGNAFCQEPAASEGKAATAAGTNPIVIVHGAWGGRHHWKETAAELQKAWKGPVYRAALTGQGERAHLASPSVNLKTHIDDVKNLIEFEDLQNVILFGHSYGGIVISGVAEVIPDRIARMAYLDASLLDSGENFFTHDSDPKRQQKLTQRAKEAGDGWAIPVDWPNAMRDVPHPLATMTDKLILENEAREKIPAEYWAFTDGGPLEKDSRVFYYRRAQERGYVVKEFKWGHNPHRESPQEVASEMLKTAALVETAK